MGSYTTVRNGKSVTVEYTDSDVLRDVHDLWAIVDGEFQGTPSAEQGILERMVAQLQAGKPLEDGEFGLLQRLRHKYAAQLKAFRSGPDNDTQGFVPPTTPGSGRILESLKLGPPSFRRLAEAGNTGAMVALYPAPDVADKLAVDGGLKPDDLHLTLAFLGDAAMLQDTERLRNVVGKWASQTPPITGQVSGTGQFTSGGDPTTYASADLPALPACRQDLVERLEGAGFPPSSLHGFTPHISLAPDIRDAKVTALPLTFDHVTLKLGPERWDFPLSGLPDGYGPMKLARLDPIKLAPLL